MKDNLMIESIEFKESTLKLTWEEKFQPNHKLWFFVSVDELKALKLLKMNVQEPRLKSMLKKVFNSSFNSPEMDESLLNTALARLEFIFNNQINVQDEITHGDVIFSSANFESDFDIYVYVINLKKAPYFQIESLKSFIEKALSKKDINVQLVLSKETQKITEKLIEWVAGVVNSKIFTMPMFGKKAKELKPYLLTNICLVGNFAAGEKDKRKKNKREKNSLDLIWSSALVATDSANFSRALTTYPSNYLNAKNYGEIVKKISRKYKLELKFYSSQELKKMGAGAFCAVDQANLESFGGIYELSYKPGKVKSRVKDRVSEKVYLVGKGLCFDTGGYDIKTNEHMITMKGDMQGSSLALSSLICAKRMNLPLEMKAFLAVTENHISPQGYKADDVVTALNGLSIEVVNTDAEGRMVLADTLTLASREKPDWIIDFATLTGTAVSAIGTKIAAVFTNQSNWNAQLIEIGEVTGERVWPFPMDEVFFKGLKSEVADTLQCSKGRSPDHILAACFLSKFIEKDSKWIHIDMTTAENSGGIGYTDSLFTGWGVHFTMGVLRKILTH